MTRPWLSAGASHTTHLFNAMPPLGHRAPGVVGAAMDAGATVELITDGLHIHPSVVRLTQRLFGERMVLISDSLRCAGMPDGAYELGGQPITVKGGKATLTGTDTLAGSSIHLMDGLRRAVSFGVPLEKAVAAASTVPARVIGCGNEIGSVAPGKCGRGAPAGRGVYRRGAGCGRSAGFPPLKQEQKNDSLQRLYSVQILDGKRICGVFDLEE